MTATCQAHHTRLQSFLLDFKVSDILLHMPCPSDFNLICQQSSIMHPLLSKRDREPVGGWSVTPTIDGGMPPHCSHFYLGHNQETLFVGSAVAHLFFHSPFLFLPVCLQHLDFLLPATAHIDLIAINHSVGHQISDCHTYNNHCKSKQQSSNKGNWTIQPIFNQPSPYISSKMLVSGTCMLKSRRDFTDISIFDEPIYQVSSGCHGQWKFL